MIRLQDEINSGRLRLLLDHNSIQGRVRGLAQEIVRFYEWEKDELIVIGLADGANIFVSDLIRLLPFKLRLYFLKISTYEGINKIKNSIIDTKELINIENNNILLIDDILDTGETLNSVIKALEIMKPKTLKTAILLCKNRGREFDIKPDFCGFNISNVFIVGFGLDKDQYYRNLVDICVIN